MLVLSRKEGERIQIGNETTITITRIKGTVVRVGIDAPKHVPVMRAELVESDDDDVAANLP